MNEKISNPQQALTPSATVLERIHLDAPRGLTVGRARSVGAMTLVPVFHDGPAADYIPYASVQGSGLFDILSSDRAGATSLVVGDAVVHLAAFAISDAGGFARPSGRNRTEWV